MRDTDSLTYSSDVKMLNTPFDGKSVVLDEPAKLKPNTKVRVIVPENGETDAITSVSGSLVRWAAR